MSDFTTLVVTDGVILFRSNILRPRPGHRLRVIEEVDPAGVPAVRPTFTPELLDKGIPGVRPISS